MSIDRYEDLNDMQLDVLREIGNIGSGNATTALSSMIGKMVDIEVPRVQFLNFQDAIDAAGGAEKNIAGKHCMTFWSIMPEEVTMPRIPRNVPWDRI